MAFDAAKFRSAVYRLLSQIPEGCVVSYGWLARNSGYPRYARHVSVALRDESAPKGLPWHRVVRGDRTLGFPKDSKSYETQIMRLADEGIALIAGKIPQQHFYATGDLDTLLWGPSPALG